VKIRIEYFESMDPDAQGGGWIESSPSVKLMSVDVRDDKVEGPGKEMEYGSFGQRIQSTPHTMAWELPVPKEDLD
jgi:hypothetical protein